MDKYTVDLDQVLNDFEYSELTDQQANNRQVLASSYVHNNFKNTNVKHSINNVFHSLNEYLNSDISPKCEIRSFTSEAGDSSNEVTIDNNTESADAIENDDNTHNEEEESKEELIAVTDTLIDLQENIESTLEDEIKNEETLEEPIIENSRNDLLDNVQVEDEKLEEKTETLVATVGFDDDIDLDDTELNQYLDEIEKEYAEEVADDKTPSKDEIVTEEIVKDKAEEVPTIRPNNLSLPDLDNETKAVIDLVGDPGSTPYNNVYVNKELPHEKPNSDPDCCTSASPTFSDISTETNSSATPSTDTVNDENIAVESNLASDVNQSIEPVITEPVQSEENLENTEVTNDESLVNASGESTEDMQQKQSSIPISESWLGKQAPLWIPDSESPICLHCDIKFTVIKRRHHCRACGYVLCSKCCNLKFRLDYLEDMARVCNKCYAILSKDEIPTGSSSSGSENNSPHTLHPNPNNPLEYCSTLPPHQQVGTGNGNPPAVMVPVVGVLKRKGSNKIRTNKSVMFCDGIRPGSDLTSLDHDFSYSGNKLDKQEEVKSVCVRESNFPAVNVETKSFIPTGDALPPTVVFNQTDSSYLECTNSSKVMETLRNEALIFALQSNLLVHVKIVNLECCINKTVWCFTTEGLISVGQDEIVILLELLDDENTVPKDIFVHINNIYLDAVKGISIKEMGLSLNNTTNFLGSKNHAGFVFIKPTFQCLQNFIKPAEPYLIGILIHRWETPWAKLFPLRLVLRLGAEYRYYPSPIISNRYRDSVFVEIGHTIINLLADFRNFSYTLPQIRGLTIHMEDKNTTVAIPMNCYDQVMKSMTNSSDHILAFAGNFSSLADSHLVCIQDTQSNENGYSTHAINIHNKPRKVTGASFIVFNGALKTSSGLTAKSSIVEDGLMIQIPPEHMAQIRESLRNMKNHTIQCGCINATSDETVHLLWGDPDVNFNTDIFSPIDNKSMAGLPSIRVHNGKDFINGNKLIRWTEVFILQNENESSRNQDPIDISKVSESIAKATCTALVKYLDLLVSNSFYKIGVRTNFSNSMVVYCAGSNGTKLPPIYMESLDNELISVLHRNASNLCDENTIILELIFRILNK